MELSNKDIDRFENHIHKTNTCWLFDGYRDRDGYCQFRIGNNVYRAHRVSYFIYKGYLPEQDLDHSCETKHCVNPDHLSPTSKKENTRRSFKYPDNEHCIRGHRLTEENTYHAPRGSPVCKECRKIWDRRRR